MAERPLTIAAAVAGLACCAGTAIASVALGGIALTSLGGLGILSGSSLVVIVGGAWLIDRRRARADEEPPVDTSLETHT